jgi:hypothetical protein
MMPVHTFGAALGVIFLIGPLFILVVFLMIIGSIVAKIGQGIGEWSSNNSQPETRAQAKVVSKRLEVSGGENSTSTRYYATFELPQGFRREYKVEGSEYGQLAEGDSGQLIYQGSRHLGFQREAATEEAPATTAPANLVCSYCGSAIPGGSIKCSNCGWTWHPGPQEGLMS